jgi:transcriptional regulator with XRE-family HTH domain
MNIVHELRVKKGIQQKELALEIGVSGAAVSDWEHQKKDPTGERLKKLAEYFEVDEPVILGYGSEKQKLFMPVDPKISGVSETEQIIQHVLEKLNDQVPKTQEARILVQGIDKLPKEQREQALNVVKAMFSQYAGYFEEGTGTDGTKS